MQSRGSLWIGHIGPVQPWIFHPREPSPETNSNMSRSGRSPSSRSAMSRSHVPSSTKNAGNRRPFQARMNTAVVCPAPGPKYGHTGLAPPEGRRGLAPIIRSGLSLWKTPLKGRGGIPARPGTRDEEGTHPPADMNPTRAVVFGVVNHTCR
jgi:hypothetical protein